MEIDISFWAAVGFIFAAYAVVGNDALQTLGTFINSNRRLPWWALFLYASTILVVVFAYGYISSGGDPSFGRLNNTEKYPIFEPQWYHALPPLALLAAARFSASFELRQGLTRVHPSSATPAPLGPAPNRPETA